MKRKSDLDSATAARPPFDTRQRKVRAWVADLPSANLAELARRINDALTQVNAQPISAGRLFYFLEAIGPAAALVFPHLERQYAGQPLPLNEAGARASNLAVEISLGLLRGYRTVLRTIVPDKGDPSGWRLFWHRHRLVTVLYRFIHYSDNLLAIYRMLHNEPPEGVWRRIHRCYRLAEKHRLARRGVVEWRDKRKHSVAHAYTRLILASLLPSGTLTPAQQRELDASFDNWVGLVRLHKPAQGLDGCIYLTRLASDFGPFALEEVAKETLEREHTCLLQTQRLCEAISKRQARDGKGRWWRREADLTPGILNLLHDNWCTVHKRAETRVAIDLAAEVAVGLSALYYLAGGRASAPPQAPRHAPPKVVMENKVEGGQWLGKTQGADVWNTVYVDPDRVRNVQVSLPTQKTGPLQHGEHEYTALPGRLVDKSDHGFAVVIARSDLSQAAPGMPLAALTAGSEWMIGVIMRMKDRGESVELGVRRLLDGAAPARLRVREGVRVSPPFDVIIGRTQDGRRAVAVPAVTALRSGDPELEVDGKNLPVGRGQILIQSRYVDAFVLDLNAGPSAAAIDQAAKAAAAAPRPGRKAAAPAPAPEEPLAAGTREERVRRLMEKTGLARTDAEFIVEAELASGGEPEK